MLAGTIAVGLAAGYAMLIATYLRNWQKLPVIEFPNNFKPDTAFSVVIPARNEAGGISECILSVIACDYPAHLFEIIVVDDHSDDATGAIVASLQSQYALSIKIKCISLTNEYGKKSAITAGIRAAAHPVIVGTDADCVVPENWLRYLAYTFETHQPYLITGPVLFHREKTILEWFQSLDLLGMMGVTGAGIQTGSQHLANGANIAYLKSVFEAVSGFAGNQHIASGDDLFLVQKIAARWPGKIIFLKSPAAAICTIAMQDWSSFIRQRLRWGTKNAALPEWSVRLSLLLVLIHSWAILVYGVLCFFYTSLMPFWAVLVIGKLVSDYVFLNHLSTFFNKSTAMRRFFRATLLHLFYIAGIGFASLVLKKYTWKKRQVG